MEKVEAYRCRYCGKLYMTAIGCEKHEAHLCVKLPERLPYCYRCRHYNPSYESDSREQIKFYEANGLGGRNVPQFKKFEPNRCNQLGCKLYNNTRLSDELQKALGDNGYRPMPSPKTGGCKYFTAKSQSL